MNAVEVAWIVAVSILVQQMVTCVYAALSSINKQQRTGKEQLRGASFLRRMKNSFRALIVFTSSLFFADALGLPIKPLITSLGFVTVSSPPALVLSSASHLTPLSLSLPVRSPLVWPPKR